MAKVAGEMNQVMTKRLLLGIVLAFAVTASAADQPAKAAKKDQQPAPTPAYPTLGGIERLDPALNALIPQNAVIERLAEGFLWAEGPVWMDKFLVFSDVPTNRVYKWEEGQGISVFLEPSGYTGSQPRGGEPGANGLTRDSKGRLVLCQHGDRRVSRLESDGKLTILAQFYKWRRFNSPNDLVYDSQGNLYFTDPPYGLAANMADPRKEIPYQGVFLVRQDGAVVLLADQISRPNGIALSPDEKVLYMANSDPDKPVIYAFDRLPNGLVTGQRVLFDATELARSGRKGLPDGLKVDLQGNLFATGPGGVLVIAPDGRLLGTLLTDEPTANCAWGNDGSVLYITANHYLLRIQTSTKGRMP